MSTALQGVYTAPTCTNLTQNFSITEGATAVDLQPFILTTGVNYSRVYTLTMTIAAPYQAANISLVCGALNGLAFTRVGNVYTLSSEYTAANGVKINNWAYFKIALQSINVTLSNSDFSDSFTITSVLTDGSTTLSGVINVYTQAQIDVVGATQTVYMPMASNNMSLVDMGGVNLAIADPAQANKTYRVTLTVNEPAGSNLYFHIRNNLIGYDSGWQKTIVISGTQTYINSLLVPTVGDGSSGMRFNNYAPDFSGYVSVSYLQEVLTTNEAVAVPYVQEGGTIGVQVAYTAPMSLISNVSYTEDSSVTFDLGNITDPAGFYWAHETCGEHAGYNCYTLTATALGTYTAENPVQLTFSGDVAINNTVTFTGTRDQVNSAINALTLIPPADHVGQIDLRVVLTRGNTPVTILDTVIAATCSSTHGDINIIAGTAFVVGTTDINFGSITDLAVGKQYSITIDAVTDSATRGALSDTTGTGVWSAVGGVNGFGRLTISGSKSVVNASLAALRYTTAVGATIDDVQPFVYTQTQTTNNILQGTVNILFANSIIWNSGNGVNNGVNAFVYDQDKTVTYDLAEINAGLDDVTTYTVKLIFSTPLSVANLGGVTDWTRETDYIWTKSGVKADLNAALSTVAFTPPAALVSNFTLDIAIYSGATLITSTELSSTKTVYIRSTISVVWSGSVLSYDQDSAATWSLATLNTYSAPNVYTIRLTTSVATGGSIAGWTTINSTTFERSDTRANLQTALDSLVFTPNAFFVSNFSFSTTVSRGGITLYSNPANTKAISIGVLYSVALTSAPLAFNQDTETVFANVATFSSNFSAAKTYTLTILTDTADVGTFTGWAKLNSTTYQRTDTGANLLSAVASLTFVPVITRVTSFHISMVFGPESGGAIANSGSKLIYIASVYQITGNNSTFDQGTAKILTGAFILNNVFNNSRTYTATLTTDVLGVGTFTGWTASGNGFTLSGPGSSIVTALTNLEFVGSPVNKTQFILSLDVVRDNQLLDDASRTIMPGVLYNIDSGSAKNYAYQTTTTFTNLATLSSNFTDASTYTLTITLPNSNGSISGTNWTGAGTSISVTGNRTVILAALSTGITFDPVAYLNSPLGFTITAVQSGSIIESEVNSFTPTGVPSLTNGNILEYYLIAKNTSFAPLANLINIPDDGGEYRVTIEAQSTQLFGTVSSSGLSWGSTTVSAISNYATKSTLEAGLANVTLNCKSSSTLQDNWLPPRWRYILQGNSAAFTPVESAYINVYNGGSLNIDQSVSIFKGTTTNLNFAGDTTEKIFTQLYKGALITFYDPDTTYIVRIDTGSIAVTIGAGWINEGGNTYVKAGKPDTLAAALSAVPVTATSTASSRDLFIRVFEDETYIARMFSRLTTL